MACHGNPFQSSASVYSVGPLKDTSIQVAPGIFAANHEAERRYYEEQTFCMQALATSAAVKHEYLSQNKSTKQDLAIALAEIETVKDSFYNANSQRIDDSPPGSNAGRVIDSDRLEHSLKSSGIAIDRISLLEKKLSAQDVKLSDLANAIAAWEFKYKNNESRFEKPIEDIQKQTTQRELHLDEVISESNELQSKIYAAYPTIVDISAKYRTCFDEQDSLNGGIEASQHIVESLQSAEKKQTSKEKKTRWTEAVPSFINSGNDANEPNDQAAVAALSADAEVEELRENPGTIKYDSNEQMLDKESSTSFERESEQDELANELVADEVPLPDKGNFASFNDLIAVTRAERQTLGLPSEDYETYVEDVEEMSENNSSGGSLEDESSDEEIPQEKASQGEITMDDGSQEGITLGDASQKAITMNEDIQEELFEGGGTTGFARSWPVQGKLLVNVPLGDKLPENELSPAQPPQQTRTSFNDVPVGVVNCPKGAMGEQQINITDVSPATNSPPLQRPSGSNNMFRCRWAPNGVNSRSDTSDQLNGNTSQSSEGRNVGPNRTPGNRVRDVVDMAVLGDIAISTRRAGRIRRRAQMRRNDIFIT